jgi:hypothetical protein
MNMPGKMVLQRQRLRNFMYRTLYRLGFFPFTFLFFVLNAARKMVLLRRGHVLVRVGVVAGEAMTLPRCVMLWLDRVLTGNGGHPFDVCLRLPPEAADANLHDVFSVLLTHPRLRSLGMYWDSSSLADDLPLLQAKQVQDDPAASAASYEELGWPSVKQLAAFLQADHGGVVLPVAAIRDAQTLLKRQAGGGYTVCLNVPLELRLLADAVVSARTDVSFFDLAAPAPSPLRAANCQSLYGHGLTLQERMALAQAADAYVGSFDELGCAALFSGRLVILLGGGTGTQPDRISSGDIAVWFPVPAEPTTLAKAVVQVLSRKLAPVK